MPGDSEIKELNLRLGLGRSRLRLGRAATRRLRPALVSVGASRAPRPSPPLITPKKRYTKGVKQNPARALQAASKSSAPLPRVGASECVCASKRVCEGGGGGCLVPACMHE